MDLPYLAKHYRLRVIRAELTLHLVEYKFTAKLLWTNGVYLTNTVLDMSVSSATKYLSAILESQETKVTVADTTFCDYSHLIRFNQQSHG